MAQTLDAKFEVRPTATFSIITLKSAKKAAAPDAEIKKMKAFVLADNVSLLRLHSLLLLLAFNGILYTLLSHSRLL